MAIVQISKIQQRSGNIVDLPQLDEAEFGWASDAKRLFIGKTVPNENIEVLTSYSTIDFNQLNGAVGNLDISSLTVENGQVLTYDGTNWVNRGGNAGGLITLGTVSNVQITGGAIGYVLETDGTGNLAWTPKSTITAYVENITKANPAVVTTTQDNFFVMGAEVTITNVPGMTQVNGNSYYAKVLTSNTFSLYSDAGLTTPVNSSAYSTFPYTSVTATTSGTDRVTVGSSSAFSLNDPIIFVGTTFGVLVEGQTYYVKSKPSGTEITISLTAGGATLTLTSASGSCNVYTSGGRVISSINGAGGTTAGGSNTTIQFNNNNILDGDTDFTWDYSTNILTVNGNANVGNINATGVGTATRFISNIATGTAPLTVTSTTRVANLSVDRANLADYLGVGSQLTGTYYPVFVNGNTSSNYGLGSNANLSFDAATGNLSTTMLSVTGNANVGNLGSTGTLTASRLISNVATGTAPLTVSSTTRVSNLSVAYSNVSDYGVVTTQTTGTFYPTFVNANTTANYAFASNANLSFNAATGALSATLLTGTLTTAAQPNVTSVGTLSSLTVTGTTTSGNFATAGNITASFLVSNVATGTSPLTVTSTTRVANLNVNYANVSDYGVVTTQTSGTYYPVFVSGNTTANYAHASNANLSFNAATGALSATLFTGTLTTAAQPNVTSVGTLSSLTVTANVTAGNVYANSGTIGATTLTASGNITGGNLSVSTGTVTLGILTTGSNVTAGTITGNWALSSGSRLNATYADLAEYYSADTKYDPGTVLEFGGTNEVTLGTDGTNKVAGVVSTDPAYAMNTNCPGDFPVAIALQGRVPVKVRGNINKGDMLISAGAGYARRTSTPSIGTVIGKALQNFSGIEGIIEIAVGRL